MADTLSPTFSVTALPECGTRQLPAISASLSRPLTP